MPMPVGTAVGGSGKAEDIAVHLNAKVQDSTQQ